MKELDVLLESKANVAIINAGDIKLQLDGLAATGGAVKATIHGKHLVMSAEAMDDLFRAAGISKNRRTVLGGRYSPTAAVTLLQQDLNRMGKAKTTFTLAFNERATVTRAATIDKKQKAISKAMFVNILELVISKNSSDIKNVSLSDDKTKAVVNITRGQTIASPINGEEIVAGTSLVWDLFGGTDINEYVMRLVCSNGMIGERLAGVHQLTNKSSADEWYKVLFKGKTTEQMAERYYNNVRANKQMNLSVREYFNLQQKLKVYKEDQEYIKKCIGDGNWTAKYMKYGVDVKLLNSGAAANYDTPINRFDAINCLTNLASNETKTYVPDMAKELDKVYAGKLLASGGDALNWNALTPKMDWGNMGSQIINEN